MFIGNVPVGTKKNELKKLCSETCGYDATAKETGKNQVPCPVESVRFRSVAVAGTGMAQGSSLPAMKKVGALRAMLRAQRLLQPNPREHVLNYWLWGCHAGMRNPGQV